MKAARAGRARRSQPPRTDRPTYRCGSRRRAAAHRDQLRSCSPREAHQVVAEASPVRDTPSRAAPSPPPTRPGCPPCRRPHAPRRKRCARRCESPMFARGVAVRRPVVRPGVRRPVRPHLPLRARRQPLAGIGARFLRLEPRDERRGDLRRQAHGVDVVGAVLAVVRARRVVVACRAQLRRPARRQVGTGSPSPAGSSSPGSRSSWSDRAPATRSPRAYPGTPSPPSPRRRPHRPTGSG